MATVFAPMGDEGKPGARQYDQVAINSIWREHVKKERATLTLNENFRLNPHALAVCRACARTHRPGLPGARHAGSRGHPRGDPPPPRQPALAIQRPATPHAKAGRAGACVPRAARNVTRRRQANMIAGKPNVDPARTGEKVEAAEDMIGACCARAHWGCRPSPAAALCAAQRRSSLPRLLRLIHRVSVVVMLRAAELDSILKETKKVPTQKYSEPIASSHEIGERQCVHALLFACGAGRVCGC